MSLAAVTKLVDRLGMITLLDAAIGPIKARERGFIGGELLVGLAAAQLAGQDFLVGWTATRRCGRAADRTGGGVELDHRGRAGSDVHRRGWRAVETGIGDLYTAMGAALPAQRAAALCDQVTIDLDTTDVEVYGSKKRGVAYNHQGVRHEARMIAWRPG